jgi:hypothetical protein
MQISARYPKRSLQCYSTYTKPDMKLICPEARYVYAPLHPIEVISPCDCHCRNQYCVKETVNLEVELCGATQYFGDIYSSGVCQLKKCSDTCVAGSYDFTYVRQPLLSYLHYCTDVLFGGSSRRAPLTRGQDIAVNLIIATQPGVALLKVLSQVSSSSLCSCSTFISTSSQPVTLQHLLNRKHTIN